MSERGDPSLAGSSRPRVLVFRKRMLPYSETFIAAQGNHLSEWQAVYAGATSDKSGLKLLQGAPTCILPDHVSKLTGHAWSWVFKRFGLIPRGWLRALSAFRPAVIHVHFGPDALFLGLPLARALRIPLVVTFHGFDIMIDAPESHYQRNRHKLFEQADRVIGVSRYIVEQLIRHGCPPEKITRHYIGLDLEKFVPFQEPNKRAGIVFVGRLTEKKGCKYLLLALTEMARRGHCPTLDIIGDGSLREELTALAKPLGDRVTFHGRQGPDFVREKVGRAAVFCVPSVTSASGDSEGLPIVNLEAMALGTPVVSTFHSGIPEAVLHGETGILVAEADPLALAEALIRCLTDEDFARKLGQNGIAHVHRTFDVRKQCQALEAIYASLSTNHLKVLNPHEKAGPI